MTPRVSIVTPVLNGAEYIADLLDSVRAQDQPEVEHIVVDGGSTDGTLEILARSPGLRCVTGSDGGMYDAINRGFRIAGGDILAYQNADDRYAGPQAVSAAVRLLQERPDVGVVYGDFRYIDARGRPLRTRRVREFDSRRLARHSFIPPHSSFVRAAAVKDDGLWLDSSLRFAGDWEWFVRLAAAGVRFAHLPAVVSEFRLHGRSATSTVGWGAKTREWRAICRRHRLSFWRLLWNEAVWAPLRWRLRME